MTIARISRFPGFLMVCPLPADSPSHPSLADHKRRSCANGQARPPLAATLVLATIAEQGGQVSGSGGLARRLCRRRSAPLPRRLARLLRLVLCELGRLLAPALLAQPGGVVLP